MQEKSYISYFRRKIQYYETDGMGIVHHSNYIRWFEEARIEFLEKYNMPYEKMEQSGVMIPVLSASCEYKIPMRFGQNFRVETYVSDFGAARFSMEYEVFDDDTDTLCTTGSTSHCFVNTNFKPIRVKKDFPEIFNVFNNAFIDAKTNKC